MAANHPHDHAHDHGPPPGMGLPERYSDPAQESLNQALRSGFNVLRVILVLLVVAYFASGVFQVQPGQQGLIARFGKLRTHADPSSGDSPVFGQGWHLALPDPFDEKVLIKGQSMALGISTFMFEPFEKERDKKPEEMSVPERDQLRPGTDGAMLTGDRNLAHGYWTVRYRIERADQFVSNIGENESDLAGLLRRLTEDSIIRTVASRTVEQVTREDRQVVIDAVKSRLQARLNGLETGVLVETIEVYAVEPGRVRPSFLSVTLAQNDRERLRKDAENDQLQRLNQATGTGYAELLKAIDAYGAAQVRGEPDAQTAELRAAIDAQLDKAQGAVAVRLQEAQSRANEQRESVRREFERFRRYLDAYRRDPQVTAVRLWGDMRTAVLSAALNEIFFVPKAGVIEIQTNRDPLKLIEADKATYINKNLPTGPANTDTTINNRRG